MQITIDIPDELVEHINYDRLNRQILEALVLQAYQNEKITRAQIGRILGIVSPWEVEAFLKEQNVDLLYDEIDLECDRQTLHQLRQKSICENR